MKTSCRCPWRLNLGVLFLGLSLLAGPALAGACQPEKLVDFSYSAASVLPGGAFTLSCDYGADVKSTNAVTTSDHSACHFSKWNGTAAVFECNASSKLGPMGLGCVLLDQTPNYFCAQSNLNSATAHIDVVNQLSASKTPSSSSSGFGIKVVGNQIVNSQTGQPVTMRGELFSSLEQGFDHFVYEPSPNFAALAAANINVIRLNMNEETWLGINNCFQPGNSQANLHKLVTNIVQEAQKYNLVVQFNLMVAAPGSLCPLGQGPMTNTDHTIDFWTDPQIGVATLFKSYPNVTFEMFNEPFGPLPSDLAHASLQQLSCILLNGTGPGPQGSANPCGVSGLSNYAQQLNFGFGSSNPNIAYGNATPKIDWNVQGFQAIVNAIRKIGATNIILVGNIGWDGNLEYWNAGGAGQLNGSAGHAVDLLSAQMPTSQIAAAVHGYGSFIPANEGGWPGVDVEISAAQAILDSGYPVVMTETEGGTGIDQFFNWADTQKTGQVSYENMGVYSIEWGPGSAAHPYNQGQFNSDGTLNSKGQTFASEIECAIKRQAVITNCLNAMESQRMCLQSAPPSCWSNTDDL